MSYKKNWPFIIIIVWGVILSGYNFVNSSFWDDEAYVGLHARNFLNTGTITGWSGRNLYAYNNGTVLDQNLRPINPPLDVLVTAASFRLLGVSTFSARLPFVIAGLITLILFVMLIRTMKLNSMLGIYALAALAFSVVFLLNARTCRYYMLAILFATLCYWCYRRSLEQKIVANFVWMFLAALGLFFSNYMLAVAFLVALLATHFILNRNQWDSRQWKVFFAGAVAFALIVGSYAVAYRIWQRPDFQPGGIWYLDRIVLLGRNFRDLNSAGYISWIVVVGLVLCGWKLRKSSSETLSKEFVVLREWGLITALYVVFLSLISRQALAITTHADVRYLVTILPFCAGLTGIFLWTVHRRTKIGAALLLLLLLCTNLLNLHPWDMRFRLLLPGYILEISQPYPTGSSAATDFLQQNASQDDLVYAYPEYLNYPTMFYLDEKIKVCCTLDRSTKLPKDVIRQLNAPLLIEQNFPDWYIAFNMQDLEAQQVERLTYFSRRHYENGRLVTYPYNLHTRLHVYWNQTQRPELFWHSFGPVTYFEPDRGVLIFKKGEPIYLDTKDKKPDSQKSRSRQEKL